MTTKRRKITYTYNLQIEHGMSVNEQTVKADNIYELRKKLIKKYGPKKPQSRYFKDSWDEWTIVVSKILSNGTERYEGTFYIYGNVTHPTYHWSINKKSNWGHYRDSKLSKSSHDIDPISGKFKR